ncbi:MAG: phospholipase domain-containing protein, partial [Komagataeibacter saccharivorans]|uniref:phospholipase domain-containing protein n=1 Tax=Komagataeibacter saccharivorans TaxID=265959 RepID=UPI0039ED16B3
RQSLPQQEPGQRPARALPYRLHVELMAPGPLHIANEGSQGAVLRIRDGKVTRHYTLGAGSDMTLPVTAHDSLPVTVHGPNGFFRQFLGKGLPDVTLRHDPARDVAVLSLHNHDHASRTVRIEDAYTHTTHETELPPNAITDTIWPIAASDHWYDLTIQDPHHAHRLIQLAGHIENGRPSHTDPHMGRTGA